MTKMLCEISQCNVVLAAMIKKPYLNGMEMKYEDRCMPRGCVTRSVLRSEANPLHSSLTSMQVSSALHARYTSDTTNCQIFAHMRRLGTKALGLERRILMVGLRFEYYHSVLL